jgi:hypothetical protein
MLLLTPDINSTGTPLRFHLDRAACRSEMQTQDLDAAHKGIQFIHLVCRSKDIIVNDFYSRDIDVEQSVASLRWTVPSAYLESEG